MKSIVKESLIKGSFDKETAIDVLTTLFESKIHLHNVKTFNRFIRTGSPSPEDSTRKTELKLSIDRLLEVIQKIDLSQQSIQIDCEVVLTIDQHKPSDAIESDILNKTKH